MIATLRFFLSSVGNALIPSRIVFSKKKKLAFIFAIMTKNRQSDANIRFLLVARSTTV